MPTCHSSINLPLPLNPFLGLCAFPRTVTHRGGGAFLAGVTMSKLRKNQGMSKTAEYKAWIECKRRCLNPTRTAYENYGGRGIKVCRRWLDSFRNFYRDMGKRPSLRHSIHRIDNDGDYKPSNCKWATQKEQCRNKRGTLWVEYQGNRITIAELAERFGLSYSRVKDRIQKCGYSIEKSILREDMTKPWDYETHCKNGHLICAENTYLYAKNGLKKRSCRSCRKDALERFRVSRERVRKVRNRLRKGKQGGPPIYK